MQKEKEGRRQWDMGTILVYAGSLLGFLFFYPLSGNWERLLEEKNLWAMLETLLVTLLLLLIGVLYRKGICTRRGRFLAVGFVIFFSLYIHRMLLPVFLSFLYFCLLGCLFFLLFRETALLKSIGRGMRDRIRQQLEPLRWEGEAQSLLPLALPFLLIQLNRMNIAADYDSLRYGLRTPYVLLNGSFFSALGQINAVYSYPKGLELLTAPLSTFHSFALLFMFQFWTLLSIAGLCYGMVRSLTGEKKRAELAVVLLCMLCSFTNMAITAKTDLITVLVQLLMLRYFLQGSWGRGLAAAVLSYAFKPTAVVFTTLNLFILLALSLGLGRLKKEEGKKAWLTLLVCFFFTGLITLRTLVITGVPISTTFTALFQRMGFHVRWPFNLDAHVDYSEEGGGLGMLFNMLRRAFLMLFCPVGEDMVHVAIAWSGVAFPLILWRALRNGGGILRRWLRRNAGSGHTERDAQLLLLCGSAVITAIFSWVSLGMLWQVDGNYYLLLQAQLLLLALIPSVSSRGGENTTLSFSFGGIPLYLCALFTTLITSWSGAVGFTPIDLVNKGYYDNIAEIRVQQAEKGSLGLWEKLSQDKSTRVLAFSETPEAYLFLCNVQSITDVEGSGGSPGLYDDLMYFEWFLGWAESDYVYLEREFLKKPESERNREMLPALLKHGMLAEPEVEGEYLLFRVDQDRLRYVWDEVTPPDSPEIRAEAEANLQIYETWLYGGS